jgi:hypothetical protein
MSELKCTLLDLANESHKLITNAIHDFGRMGYMVSSISHKDGGLEVLCYPPKSPFKWVPLSGSSDNQAKSQ